MTTARTLVALAAFMTSLAVPALAQAQVTVRFPSAGMVSISARNVPLRTILAEWSRVGGSRFVNAEKITGAPLTIELTNVSERKAIETLLRGISGYIVGARAAIVPGSSTFDRIMIVPTAAPRQAATAATPTAAPPVFSPTPAPFVPSEPDDDTENGGASSRGMPTLLQQQLREATERAEAARQNRGRQEPEEDEDEEQDEPATPTARPGPSPFGNVQGSARPGEITTTPRRNNRSPENER